jgi:hypothetical protein
LWAKEAEERFSDIESSKVKMISEKGIVYMGIVKEEARKLIDQLPEQATWDDIMYQLYIRKKIDKGLEAIKEGKVISHDEAKKRIFQ